MISACRRNGHSAPARLLDAVRKLPVALFRLCVAVLLIFPDAALRVQAAPAESKLAIVEAGIEEAEDAPFAPKTYRFLPGEYVFVFFKIAGFEIESAAAEVRRLSLSFEVTAEDARGIALAALASGEIKEEINPQDKEWIPTRRTSFQLPSFVAAGEYHVHIKVKDVFAKTETAKDLPFLIGGTEIKRSAAVTAENVRFLRTEEAREPLQLPAYRAGDTVFMRFEMAGFKTSAKNGYHVAYGVKVLRPNGSLYFEDVHAAELSAESFYPAQFVPGNLALTTSADSSSGQYTVILNVRDLVGGQTAESRTVFQIE